MPPAGRVKGFALKLFESGHGRGVRRSELPPGRHEESCTVFLIQTRSHDPLAGVVLPLRRDHLFAEPKVLAQSERVGEAIQVSAEFVASRVHPADPQVRREAVAIKMRLRVAGGTRIVVVAPDTADVVGSLQNDEVVDTAAFELRGHAQPAEAGTDDQDLVC